MKTGEPFNPHRRFNGIFVPLGLLRYQQLSDGSKLLYGRLCLFAGPKGECYADRATIAAEMGLHVATISRQLQELTDEKFLRRVRRGLGMTAKCEFLWHAALEACERTPSDVAKVRDQGNPPDVARMRGQTGALMSQECASDVAKVRDLFKEEKIPLKDSHTLPVNGHTRAAGFTPSMASEWSRAGWDSPEDFENWWNKLVSVHPNKNRNGVAKSKALDLILAGHLQRSGFDQGYAALRAASCERWAEERGRYVPNLWQLLDDQQWKHAPPPMPAAVEYPSSEDYLRRIESE